MMAFRLARVQATSADQYGDGLEAVRRVSSGQDQLMHGRVAHPQKQQVDESVFSLE
jgi:hypothetical protein